MIKQKVWLALAVTGLATAVAFLPPGSVRQVLAFLLLWVVPIPFVAAILKGRLRPGFPQKSRAAMVGEWEKWLMAAGLVLLTQPLLALVIHYLPGPMPTWPLFLLPILLTFLPFLRHDTRLMPSLPKGIARSSPLLLLVFLLALLLRWPNMGYKEIQGDEGVILVRAAAALTGDEAELFLHQKGPMEILLPLVTWGVSGALTDFWARLPFLWAGLLGVAAVMALARRWFNGRVALAAGFLLAIMGFSVAFSRIIQYQTLVMLWGTLALLAATRYRDEGRPLDLYLATVFLAGGLLAHYDAVLVGPAWLWILLKRTNGKRVVSLQEKGSWRHWISAGVLGTSVLASFYVPFALSPNFERTVRYLLRDRVGTGSGLTGWSGAAVWQMMTFYNSTYYIVGLIGLLLVGVWVLWRRQEGAAAVLTFLIPALFYSAVVSDPRTHVYTIFPGAIILAAVGAAALGGWSWLQPWLYRTGLVLGLTWFIVSAVYVYLMFVDVTPERQRTWTENRPSFYATTWEQPPLYGLFGFPHQAGWRSVPRLLDNNFAAYASNEEEEITNWYMRQAPRRYCPPFDTFIWTAETQDEVPYDPDWLQHLQVEVVVNGQVSLRIYGREAVSEVKRVVADGRQLWFRPQDIAPSTAGGTYPVHVTFGDRVRLLGYDLDTSQAYPGGQVVVTLYWQPLVPFTRNYQVFTHLYDGQMRGQHDGAPACAMKPTTRWEPGQIIPDTHLIPITVEAQPGPVPLLVGMYDLLDGQRLTVPESVDNSFHLTDVFLEAR